MIVNILIDESLKIDISCLEKLLNNSSKSIEFKTSQVSIKIDGEAIIFPESHAEIYDQLSPEEKNSFFNFIFTDIPYGNNFFFEGFGNLVPFSMYDWDYLTNLPIENGILFFVINYLARVIEDAEVRHYDNTGCIYDFLGDKRGVDHGMRNAAFCKNCLDKLEKQVLGERDEKIVNDLKILMNILSTSSKWNKSILEGVEIEKVSTVEKRKSINPEEIHVVIASPGDLLEERKVLLEKLERKFRLDEHERISGYRLIVHGWEDIASQNGYPQDVINEEIISKMDIVLAMFKHKLGSPTIDQTTGKKRAVSGTAEELLTTLDNEKSNKALGMLYFYSKPPSPSFEADNYDQMKKDWDDLKKFKTEIRNKILHKPFTEPNELIETVSKDILKNILKYFEQLN